jgi:glycosyltransferase involved in cell wall biosynthesis
VTVRVAVLLPAPAPYREPLLAELHAKFGLDLRVIYQSAVQPSWNVAPGWFPHVHPYPALYLRAYQCARPGRTPLLWPRGVERALAAADPDCVVASEYGAASLRALAWCRRHRRAFVVYTECTPEMDAQLLPGQLCLHRWVASHADWLIPVSTAGRTRLESFGVAPQRITVATQPADLEPVRAAAAVCPRPQPPPLVVLTAGRLVPDKNLSTLIEAVARVDPAGESIALHIAGTGFQENELRALAAARGLPVRFHGAVSPAAMGELYAAAHVFALVSTFEPFGVVVREAVAAGLPIVCSRRAGAAGDVAVEGRNALLVDPEDVAGIAAALERIIGDPALRAALAAGSRQLDAAGEGADVAAFAAAARAAAARRGRSRAG